MGKEILLLMAPPPLAPASRNKNQYDFGGTQLLLLLLIAGPCCRWSCVCRIGVTAVSVANKQNASINIHHQQVPPSLEAAIQYLRNEQ